MLNQPFFFILKAKHIVMVYLIWAIAVQLKLLVQSMKVTVTVTLNAKETLNVGLTIVLHIFHIMQIAVKPLLVRKYHGFNWPQLNPKEIQGIPRNFQRTNTK